ncbi:hypothetical protein FACS1894185_6290 [Betaproteobacteria bacterium]|nr:hypothetical protein FACS1894185_6290 [Betaproteobacteria bacterium]
MEWSAIEKITVFGVIVASAWYLPRLFAGKKKPSGKRSKRTVEHSGTGGVQQFNDSSAPVFNAPVFNAPVIHNHITQIISQEKSAPLSVLQTVLASMGEEAQGFNPEKVEELLRLKADEYNKLKAQLVGFKESDAGIQQLRKEVAAAMDNAQFDKARAILLEIRKHDEKALAQRLYSNAETSITLAGIEKLNVTPAGYRAAAGYYAEAAGIIGAIDPAQAREYRRQQATTLHNLGEVFGDQGALLEAIEIYRGVLREISKENEAEEWAMTQNNLGVVLQILGSHEGNQHTLQETVAAYHAALEVRTRDQAPMDWAATQNNLGNALGVLGKLEDNPHTLQEAVSIYHAALEVRTRDQVPMAWAMTQNNLGNVLGVLGEREGNPHTLQESVVAYRAALEVITRDQAPMDWAMTQNNLGNALQVLGKLEGNPRTLQEAITAYRAALEVRTRDQAPMDWAMTQNNLGVVLQVLGELEGNPHTLQESIAAYRAALEVRTRDQTPVDWAMTQNNLGNALRVLGELEGNPRTL